MKPDKAPYRQDSSGDLVQIYLVEPIDIDPVPDKAFTNGRFAKLLTGIGAKGRALVRARMITIVAETKFRTTTGLPISLIGLHGKDEVLVLGPVWALERLAAGESVRAGEQRLAEATRVVASEIESLRQCASYVNQVLCGDDSREATDFVESFFRCSRDEVDQYFQTVNVNDFVSSHLAEATTLQESLRLLRNDNTEYREWWWAWEREDLAQLCRVASGRHVSGYPVSKKDRLREPRPVERP